MAIPQTEEDWTAHVKSLLKPELTKRRITCNQLTEKLAIFGVHDTSMEIRNKVARGKFTGVFFVQCLEAFGCKALHLDQE